MVTFPSAGEPLLAPALSTLTRSPESHKHPVDITVTEAEPDEALPAVRNGDADLALVYHFHTPEPPTEWRHAVGPATYTPLVDDQLRLLVPADHRLAHRESISLAEVAEERWIHAWGETGNLIDTLAAVHGFRPEVACRSSDYRFMSALVSAGVGIALVPTLALTDHPGVAALALAPQPVRYVGAYLPTRQWRSPTAEALLTTLLTTVTVLP